MKTLRIQGVVGFADQLRRELSGSPISPERKSQLRSGIMQVIKQVDRIVAEHGTRIEALPSPTRRAYQFLAKLDLDAARSATPADAADPRGPSTGRVRIPHLQSSWQHVLQRLAEDSVEGSRNATHIIVRTTSETLEKLIKRDGIATSDLTDQSRTARGWHAYFADRRKFDAYTGAVDRAKAAFEAVMKRAERFSPPALVEFRPINSLYKIRGHRDRTRVMLPTPMIVFSQELFDELARASLLNGDKQPILAATGDEAYQSVEAELAALCGEADWAEGVHRDLGASFDRVSARYFGGSLARPRLTWSTSFTGRKFGHYDPIRDTVMISASLDQTDVPDFALDFVVYHELLHKELGIDWRNGRATAHTPEFRAREQKFDRYKEADAVLKKVAGGRL